MSQDLEQLVRQEQVLDSIRGIVRTMKTLAAINAAPYEQAARSIDAWHETVRDGLQAYAYCQGNRPSDNPGSSRVRRHILVAFGSDHGFCGNYNELVARRVSEHMVQVGDENPVLLCIGAKLQIALESHLLTIDDRLTPPASVDGLGRLSGEIVTQIETRSRDVSLQAIAVDLVYTRRGEHGMRETVVEPLLPLKRELLQAPVRWPSRALPFFTLPAPRLLSALLRNLLFASVFQASAEAMVTENAARLAIMQQAEQTVEERLELLRRDIAGKRQDAITQELMDILTGHTDD